MDRLFPGLGFFADILNALPSPLFVVDDDVRILYLNGAASELLGDAGGKSHMKRGGDVLHCLHSAESPGGCGSSVACRECVIRNSVREAFQGNKVTRKKTRMTLTQNHRPKDIQMLVTAAPFRSENAAFSLLILEDVTELLQLKGLLPICAWCKKIRTDKNYWQNLEEYLGEHHALEFSHGLCEDCYRKHYPELDL